jgi:hypothetical protein
MIPAYDVGPVGGGVTFLPKGKREGSCARSSVARLHRPVMSGAYLLRRSRANPSACLAHDPERYTPQTDGRDLVLIRRAPFLALWSSLRCNRGWWVGHKNRLAPALGLEIPRLTPADSPSWSCTVGDREDPPSTTPDHLPNPPDRSHDPRLRCWPRRWGCNVPPQGEARGVMCQVLSCTTPPTRNVGGLSPETEPCEPISRRWAGPQRGTSQPHGDVSHSGPSDPKSPLVLCPGLWW